MTLACLTDIGVGRRLIIILRLVSNIGFSYANKYWRESNSNDVIKLSYE